MNEEDDYLDIAGDDVGAFDRNEARRLSAREGKKNNGDAVIMVKPRGE